MLAQGQGQCLARRCFGRAASRIVFRGGVIWIGDLGSDCWAVARAVSHHRADSPGLAYLLHDLNLLLRCHTCIDDVVLDNLRPLGDLQPLPECSEHVPSCSAVRACRRVAKAAQKQTEGRLLAKCPEPSLAESHDIAKLADNYANSAATETISTLSDIGTALAEGTVVAAGDVPASIQEDRSKVRNRKPAPGTR
jgi:hypothetical protein